MLMQCLKIICYCFLGSITTVICTYFLIYAASWVICLISEFLFGGEDDEE